MSRHFLIVAVLLGFPLVLLAQAPPPPPPPRAGGFGGGVRPSAPLPSSFYPTLPAINPVGGVAGGFMMPGNHRPGLPPLIHWGGWLPFYGYPDQVYPYPTPVQVNVAGPTFQVVQPPETPIELSGETTAVLVLEFSAAAEVWINGKKGEGDAHTEWTLTSPALKTGTEYTFKVKARWKANGKTFEYERTVAVAAGNRSRSLVLSGTEIKE